MQYFNFATDKKFIFWNEVITFDVAAKLNFELDIIVSSEFEKKPHIPYPKKKSMRKKKC